MDTSEVKTLEVLDRAEAVALLETGRVGRLVYTRRALPVVTPVNYVLREGAVWFWSASISVLAQAKRHGVVGFEADHIDSAARTGWSVLVVGVPELITDEERIAHARVFGPEPWAPGRREHLIRIPIGGITGRLIDPWFPALDQDRPEPTRPSAAPERD